MRSNDGRPDRHPPQTGAAGRRVDGPPRLVLPCRHESGARRARVKLLLINPNISEDVTAIMAAEARRSASPGTEIAVATARFGALYIENRIEASIGSHAVLDALAEHGAGADAAIISAFGD